MKQIIAFFGTLSLPARFCFLLVVFTAVMSCYSWLPVSAHPKYLVIFTILAAVASWMIGFTSMTGFLLVMRKYDKSLLLEISLPATYWQLFAGALVYFIVVFRGAFVYYPHGVDLGPTVDLRMATSFSLLFTVISLGFIQHVGLRFNALQSALTTQSR